MILHDKQHTVTWVKIIFISAVCCWYYAFNLWT